MSMPSEEDLIVCRTFEGPPTGYLPITEYARAVARIKELESICLSLDAKLTAVRTVLDTKV